METVKVQWQALSGQWLVQSQENTTYTLAEWAQSLPDLTHARLLLDAQNYSVHWLQMSGIKARHLAKALPFALEESLINDISDYVIIPAGIAHKKNRAYVLTQELIDNLLSACEVQHILVRELIPETWLLESAPEFKRSQQGWLISIAGVFEGYVNDGALTPVLESIFAEDVMLETLVLKGSSMDQLQLLKSMLETSFPNQVQELTLELTTQATWNIPARPLNLLTGRYQAPVIEKKPAPWWMPVLGVAAVWLCLWTIDLYMDVRTLKQQSIQVQNESVALYQALFPGERVRSLERQFREKLNGKSDGGEQGFVSITNTLARLYHQEKLQEAITLNSLRFNDRLNELTIDVRAASLNDLQTLRQALEKEGLKAEIAQATNDDKGVKGRIRIGGQA